MGPILAVLLVAVIGATPAATTPREVVQSSVARVMAMVQEFREGSPSMTRGRARVEIRRIAGDLFDYDEMSRRSLSRYWAGLRAPEQAEFILLFTDLLERTYLGRIQSYASDRIDYLGEGVDGPFATVKSRVLTSRSPETTVDYRLRLRDGQWRVYDVLIDGVSFLSTYRSEFHRVIQRSSYEALVQRMRGKTFTPPAAIVTRPH